MGLIDIIDDRDTTFIIENDGAVTPVMTEKFKEWLTMLKNELPTDAKVDHLGGGRYRIELSHIVCTGSQVEQIINIPFMHQLLKMELKHTDSANTDSNDALTYSLYQRFHKNTWALLMTIPDSTASDMSDEYIEYYRTLGEYRLLIESTNTDRAHIAFYIRITGE